MTIQPLQDKDRIFTNLYGFQSPDLKAAQARGIPATRIGGDSGPFQLGWGSRQQRLHCRSLHLHARF